MLWEVVGMYGRRHEKIEKLNHVKIEKLHIHSAGGKRQNVSLNKMSLERTCVTTIVKLDRKAIPLSQIQLKIYVQWHHQSIVRHAVNIIANRKNHALAGVITLNAQIPSQT